MRVVMSEEIIDNSELTEHQADVSYSHGFSFPLMPRLLALLFFILGSFSLISGTLIGLVVGLLLVILGGFGFSSSLGIDVCLRTNYIREYHLVYFLIKMGKWKSTASYPDICILKLGKSKTTHQSTGAFFSTMDASINEVFFMTANHRKRILIAKCASLEAAVNTAKMLEEKTGKSLKEFNPKISEQTKARR
jgi:hypothetical protein